MSMTYEQIQEEIKYLKIKYPEYKDWFWDNSGNLNAIALDMYDAGHVTDGDNLMDMSDDLHEIEIAK